MNRILTPSSLPCKKCTAPERCMPGKNQTGCVNSRRSTRPKSQGGESSEPRDVSLDVSPSAKIPPSELDTRDNELQQQQQHQGIMLIKSFAMKCNEIMDERKQQDRRFLALTLVVAKIPYDFSGNTMHNL
uniref:Uncharacterized protein n=1 Tax=Glossina palpalis gambiensis TaxID=67801 RepID=A0A1B0AN72_9MUSC